MPEGPLVLLYRDDLSAQLLGRTVEDAETTLRAFRPAPLLGRTLTAASAWGKYLFLLFEEGGKKDATLTPVLHLRIHWGMFGIYTLDRERSGKSPKAVLSFSGDRVLRLYAVSLRLEEGGLPSEDVYDPRADVMSPRWDAALAVKKLGALPASTPVCDALLDQAIFAGLGNAIKTEALFALNIHPESRVGALPPAVLEDLVEEAVGQSQLFLEGKRAYGADRYGWTLVYRRKTCPRCGTAIVTTHTGALGRKSHWCPACAVKWV